MEEYPALLAHVGQLFADGLRAADIGGQSAVVVLQTFQVRTAGFRMLGAVLPHIGEQDRVHQKE
jgi:hypothetical protein